MIGQTVSHYRITEELGGGGMGVVYKAEDTRLKRTVALKFLPADLTRDQNAKTRFMHEAQAASALQHHNICTIHQIDETDDGQLFICMDCYDGETLREKIAGGTMPAKDALDIAIEVTGGLAKAHEAGMVHRDIKPANVMVTSDGVIKILDFGLAKLAGQTKVTKTGTTVGTVAYMSPEQAKGEEVDQRSDVWSVGAMLHEMLTGEQPFKGDHELAVMYGIMNNDPESVTASRPDLPVELDWIVAKTLSKDPGDRYQSSAELLNDLRAAIKPYRSESGEDLTIAARPPRRKPGFFRPAVLAGVVIAAAVVAAAVYFWPRSDESRRQGYRVWEGTPQVAVAPIENKTGDASLDHVADLATETIAQGLAGLDFIETVPLDAAAGNGDTDIGVSGAIYLDDGGLRFQARVTEAESGRLMTALPAIRASRDSPGDGIEQVSQRVMGALAVQLYNPFRQMPPTSPPTYEAFKEYRQALDGFDKEWGGRSFLAAIRLLHSAAKRDTTFLRPLTFVPPLYLGMGGAWAMAQADTVLMDLDNRREELDEYDRLTVDMLKARISGNTQAALGLTRRLLHLAPDDQIIRMMEILFLDELGRYEEVLESYEKLNPSEDQERRLIFAIQTRRTANALHALGRYDEELVLRQRLSEYYPDLLLMRVDELFAYTSNGRHEEIRRILEECQAVPGSRGYLDWTLWTACDAMRAHGYGDAAIEILNEHIEYRLENPNEDRRYWFKTNVARLMYGAERWEDAAALLKELEVDHPEDAFIKSWLGRIAARQGDLDTARRVEAEYLTEPDGPYEYGGMLVLHAEYAALLGEQDRAVRLLREAGANGFALNHKVYHNMDFESLRGYEPFEELIRPKG